MSNLNKIHPWARKHPIYQVDFSVAATGKTVSASKRRIRWRFGFVNSNALASGATGIAARGEEHDLDLVWSLSSGKRQLLIDQQEVHFSTRRNMNVDVSAPWRGDCIVKVIAFATKPLGKNEYGMPIRQYDLMINGQSFFDMPRLFELGHLVEGGHNATQVTQQIQQQYHCDTSQVHETQYAPASATIYHQSRAVVSPGCPTAHTLETDILSEPSREQPLSVSAQPNPYHDPFAPQQTAPPTLSDISNQVMNIYGQCSNNLGPVPNHSPFPKLRNCPEMSPLTAPTYDDSSNTSNKEDALPINTAEGRKLNLQVETSSELSKVNDFSEKVKALVNLDDINSPVEGSFRLTMDDATSHAKSKPISKKAQIESFVGPKPTLSEMKSSKAVSGGGSKQIMKQPLNYGVQQPQGGALVVYGGAPPLQRSVGFGVGAHLQNGGYANVKHTHGFTNRNGSGYGQQYAY